MIARGFLVYEVSMAAVGRYMVPARAALSI